MVVPWVFHRNGKPILNFHTAWTNAKNKAGLPGKHVHDMRRTAVRNLVNAGIGEKVAMTITGHKTRSVFDRYHIVSASDQEEALRKLADKRRAWQVTRTEDESASVSE